MTYRDVKTDSLAERLLAARKAAKITQETAAQDLGMSRPTFIAIEKGVRRPKPEELVRLATLYGTPVSQLLRKQDSQKLTPHLRSALDATHQGQEGLQAAVNKLAAFVEDYQLLEAQAGVRLSSDFPPAVRVPAGPVERFAEVCAKEERERLNLGSHLPVSAPRKLLEKVGIHVFVDSLDSKLAGMYAFAHDFGYCILINRVHPLERRRWTVAHEYAHFLIDRDEPGVDYVAHSDRKPRNERFADSFAAAFLMPEAGIQKRFYEDLEKSGDFNVGDLCRMADYFVVSVMAACLRLEQLKLIPRGSWDQLSEERVPVRSLREEAGLGRSSDGDLTESYPERYRLLAVQQYLAGRFSEGQLAKLLRCDRLKAREIVELCSQASDDMDGTMSMVPLSLSHSLISGSAGSSK
ncbi:helix-turn-helix domain-containing protein [Frateuria sp. GZRR35]|uniref:helix-turn-helix domain-containing protein n=1 Tax=Frateuria sp. GZRR35 TaxID=3351536 RepID=UPI003EDC9785